MSKRVRTYTQVLVGSRPKHILNYPESLGITSQEMETLREDLDENEVHKLILFRFMDNNKEKLGLDLTGLTYGYINYLAEPVIIFGFLVTECSTPGYVYHRAKTFSNWVNNSAKIYQEIFHTSPKIYITTERE